MTIIRDKKSELSAPKVQIEPINLASAKTVSVRITYIYIVLTHTRTLYIPKCSAKVAPFLRGLLRVLTVGRGGEKKSLFIVDNANTAYIRPTERIK